MSLSRVEGGGSLGTRLGESGSETKVRSPQHNSLSAYVCTIVR